MHLRHATHVFAAGTAALCLGMLIPAVLADDATADGPIIAMAAFRVEAEAESDHFVQGPFLPDVQGTKINIGKKTNILDFDALPSITGNNYRQALALAPGLVLSEETTPLVSIGYRGLNPHRVQFTQVLTDGVPIHAEQFGYPEAYYTPPLDTVDRIEFVHGGAALMFGPQPGGALSYITHRPRTDRPFSLNTEHTFGSDNYYSTFTSVDGTKGRVGYYGYFNHRETDGFRTVNSDVKLNAYYGRLALDAATASRWLLTVESYDEEHGEPGGLTFATGTNAVNYGANRDAVSRPFDRFNLRRKAATLIWEHDLQNGTLSARAWAVDYLRASRRQNGGGYGTLPSGAAASTNSIERQQFDSYGAEFRGRHDWGSDHQNVFSAGAQLFTTDSPRVDSTGATPTATSGTVRVSTRRDTLYAPVFVENLFRFGALSITPGFRLENIRQRVEEKINTAKTAAGTPLGRVTDSQTVPLFGLATAWKLAPRTEVYFNVSQSYRPVIFTQAVPAASNAVVPADLRESRALQYELGYRTQTQAGLVFDASLFHLEFDDQIGSVTLPGGVTSVGNVGRAVHRGAETSVQLDLIKAFHAPLPGELNVYASAMLLDAGFKDGPQAGRTPQQAPDHLVRTGLIYSRGQKLKIALLGTIADQAYGDDNNSASRIIPAYMVWDLTAEARISGTPFRVLAGINNLFDEDYYSRITSGGIDPAPRRNFYIGVGAEF